MEFFFTCGWGQRAEGIGFILQKLKKVLRYDTPLRPRQPQDARQRCARARFTLAPGPMDDKPASEGCQPVESISVSLGKLAGPILEKNQPVGKYLSGSYGVDNFFQGGKGVYRYRRVSLSSER